MKRHFLLVLALAGLLAISACSENTTAPVAEDNASFARSPQKTDDSIAQIALENGYTELVEALSYVDSELNTGLVDLFSTGTDQYTVFAPSNLAFENLYGLLSDVLGTEIGDITDLPASIVLDVLLYHVTEGRRGANSVVPNNNMKTITPLLGENFYVRTDLTIKDGLTGIRADDAMIDGADLSAFNGIVHTITEVIVPPSVVAAITAP